MKVRRCTSCNKYRYIEGDGLCRSCYTGIKDRSSEYRITYDPSELLTFKKGTHQLVFGAIGSGKTVGNRIEIAEMLKKNKDVEVHIIDRLSQYQKFTEEYNGNIVKVGDNDSFNIFNYFGADNKEDFNDKVDQIYDLLIRCFDEGNIDISTTHERLVKVVVSETYKRKGITPQTSNVKKPPRFSDMVAVIDSLQSNPDSIMKKNSTRRQKKQVKSTLSDLHSKVKSIDKEFNISTSSVKNKSKNHITYYNLKDVSSGLSQIKHHTVFNEVWERARTSDKKSVLYIDGACSLIDLDKPISSLNHCFATARSKQISISLVTQRHQEFLSSNSTNGIIPNIYNIRIHRLSSNFDQVKEKFNLSDSQLSYLDKQITVPTSILRRHGNKGFDEEKISVDSSLLDDI